MLILLTFGQRDAQKLSIGGWFLLVFWAIYSVRFLHDTLVEGLVIRGNLFKLYAITFGNCLLPAFACLRAARFVRLSQAIRVIRLSLNASCLAVLIVLYKIHGTLNPVLLERARFTVELEGGETYNALNPITIGFFGESLLLFSLGVILFNKGRKVIPYDFVGGLLGLVTLILGGSRGPALGAFIGVAIMLLLYVHYLRKTSYNILRFSTSIVFLLTVVAYWIVPKLLTDDLTLIRRFYDLAETLSASNGPREFRSYQWESALNMFYESPIWGDRYLERFANFYPHNVYLEVFMSTGLVGAIFFYGMMSVLFFQVLKVVHAKSDQIVFFWPLYAILMWMLTSGSIFEGVAFWTFMSFWFGINSGAKREKIIS